MARLTRRKILKKPGKENESSCEKDTVTKSKTRSNVKNRRILGDQTNCNTPDVTLKSKLDSSLKDKITNVDLKKSVTALLPEIRNSILKNELTELDNSFRGFEDKELTESPKLTRLRELRVILERIPIGTNKVNIRPFNVRPNNRVDSKWSNVGAKGSVKLTESDDFRLDEDLTKSSNLVTLRSVVEPIPIVTNKGNRRPLKKCKEFNDINEDVSDKRKDKITSKTPSSRKKTAKVVLRDKLNKNNDADKSVSLCSEAKKGKGRVLVYSVTKPVPRVSLSLKRTAKKVEFENINNSDRSLPTCSKETFVDQNIDKKKVHVPIYATKVLSDVDKTFPNEDPLHLYDFEVDENEPKVKKARKKPIRKMTKYKTYKNKMKLAGDEAVVKIKNKDREPLKEVKMNKTDKIVKRAARVATPKPVSRTEDPKPYSPMEDLSLPVMLADMSKSVPQPSCFPESSQQPAPHTQLDTTAASIPSDRSNSSYQSIYALPDLFIGSSTPIRCHWTDNSVSLLNRTQTINQCKQFDVSNCFGFDEEQCFEEPLVSPIKRTDTPAKPLQVAKKPTIDRPRVSEVIRMLRFGPHGTNDEEELPELYKPIELPTNFYHDCDTPEFSPQSISASPEMLHTIKPSRKSYERPRKKVARFRNESESEDEEVEEEVEEIVPVRQTKKRGAPTKKERTARTIVGKWNLCTGPGVVIRDSPSKQQDALTKWSEVLRRKGVDINVTKSKILQELELENWAKAFNQQCMEVENFNLCVE